MKDTKQWPRAFFREDLRYRKCAIKWHPSHLVVNSNHRKLCRKQAVVTQRLKFHK